MKLSFAIVLLLAAIVTCKSIRQNVGVEPTPTVVLGYASDSWVSNIRCTYHSENDCELSIHANGRRLDPLVHKPNEDVVTSCLSSEPSLDLVTHGFTYDDVQDYTCLEDVTNEFVTFWVQVTPVIEASGTFEHGQQVQLACNAPPGSPLYWVLPGSASDHQGAVITDTSNTANSSSTVTFTIQEVDHFADYKCCVGLKTGQPPSDATCASYFVEDSDVESIVSSTADYSTILFDFRVEVTSNPLPDPDSVRWHKCSSFSCNLILPADYFVQSDPDRNFLSSRLPIGDDSFYTFYNFSVNATDDSVQDNVLFTVARGEYVPKVTQLPTEVFYNPGEDTTSVVIKFSIDSNPAPTATFFKQQTRENSLGAEPLSTGGHYAVDLAPVSGTEYEATIIIGPYNGSIDNAIYTLRAENLCGKTIVEADSSFGPSYLNLNRVANVTNSFTCDFQSFPSPPSYEIHIVSAFDSNYTIASQTYDPIYSLTTLTVDVALDPRNTYYTFRCTAYNPYNSEATQTKALLTTL